jgi:hypothetical protein
VLAGTVPVRVPLFPKGKLPVPEVAQRQEQVPVLRRLLVQELVPERRLQQGSIP